MKTFSLNQRGQGFEVFKLLIAAIVAVFILTIMLQILQGIKPPTQGNPNQEASSKIKTLTSALGTPERTGFVIFNKDTTQLNARTIANLTGSLDESQICLTVSSVFEDSFEKSGASGGYGGVLNFKAQQLQAKLWVICDSGNSVDNSVNNAGLSDEMPGCSGTGDSKTVCYVSVVSTN